MFTKQIRKKRRKREEICIMNINEDLVWCVESSLWRRKNLKNYSNFCFNIFNFGSRISKAFLMEGKMNSSWIIFGPPHPPMFVNMFEAAIYFIHIFRGGTFKISNCGKKKIAEMVADLINRLPTDFGLKNIYRTVFEWCLEIFWCGNVCRGGKNGQIFFKQKYLRVW